ncbi:MAG: NAD(P)H-dependent oxidoreductase [Ruminococcaceae bacterium]|nr:NAD(P)H-dependent oxidoreductase [Oscillospiraceae bacterium]
MSKLKILAVVGSLRRDSLNLQLAKKAGELLADEAEFEILDFSDVPFFNQDIEYPAPEAVSKVRDKVINADGVWFFSPEYNHFFSGVLKNLLDWLSRKPEGSDVHVLFNKPAALSGITFGMSGTALSQDNLVTLLSFLNLDIMNVPRLVIPNADSQLGENGRLKLTASEKYLEKQASSFMQFIRNRK